MIQDARFDLSTNQAITTATAFSTNFTDVGDVIRDYGGGEPFYLEFLVTETFTDASGTPTLQINVILDALVAATPGLALTVIGSSLIFGEADLVAGTVIPVAVNPIGDAQRIAIKAAKDATFPFRYLGASYVLAGGTFATGKISCSMSKDHASRIFVKHYSDAVN